MTGERLNLECPGCAEALYLVATTGYPRYEYNPPCYLQGNPFNLCCHNCGVMMELPRWAVVDENMIKVDFRGLDPELGHELLELVCIPEGNDPTKSLVRHCLQVGQSLGHPVTHKESSDT